MNHKLEPITVNIIDNELYAEIYPHVINLSNNSVDSCVYITKGFNTYLQTELTIVYAQKYDTEISNAPLKIFALLFNSVKENIKIKANCYTEFDSLLWEKFKSITYISSEYFREINIPPKNLLIIPLTPSETEVAKNCGISRVLTLLGKTYSFFPFPYWLDKNRDCTIGKIADSLITHTARTQIHQSNVTINTDLNLITLKINKNADIDILNKIIKDNSAFIILTDFSPEASSSIVWTNNSSKTQAITSPIEKNSITNGNFILFLTQEKQTDNDIQIVEDGFSVSLKKADWKALTTSILEKKSYTLKQSYKNQMSLKLIWF